MAALRCRILPEGAALEPTVRHMRLHLFAVVVLGLVLPRSAPMYHALGVCVCCGGVRLYRVLFIVASIIKLGESLFR